MKPQHLLFSLAFFILIIAVVLVVVFKHPYDLTRWEEKDGVRCTTILQSCSCYGLLTTLESDPPIYTCNGYATCTDRNETTCA